MGSGGHNVEVVGLAVGLGIRRGVGWGQDGHSLRGEGVGKVLVASHIWIAIGPRGDLGSKGWGLEGWLEEVGVGGGVAR